VIKSSSRDGETGNHKAIFLFLNCVSHEKRGKRCELITGLISIAAGKHLSECVKRVRMYGKRQSSAVEKETVN